ncbi:MAG: hypothetical protein AAF958_00270 [Planctomycetota bacterium]
MKAFRFLMIPVVACTLTFSVGCEPAVKVDLSTDTSEAAEDTGSNDTAAADLPAGETDGDAADLPADETP